MTRRATEPSKARTPAERLEYLEALIDTWPPLTREQQDCLAILLHPKDLS